MKVTVKPHDRDAAGREGIGLVWGPHIEFVFDAKTFELLGSPDSARTVMKVVDHVKQR
jgi:hypothetical protein